MTPRRIAQLRELTETQELCRLTIKLRGPLTGEQLAERVADCLPRGTAWSVLLWLQKHRLIVLAGRVRSRWNRWCNLWRAA